MRRAGMLFQPVAVLPVPLLQVYSSFLRSSPSPLSEVMQVMQPDDSEHDKTRQIMMGRNLRRRRAKAFAQIKKFEAATREAKLEPEEWSKDPVSDCLCDADVVLEPREWGWLLHALLKYRPDAAVAAMRCGIGDAGSLLVAGAVLARADSSGSAAAASESGDAASGAVLLLPGSHGLHAPAAGS